MNNFEVNGAVPLTQTHLQLMIESLRNDLLSQLTPVPAPNSGTALSDNAHPHAASPFQVWTWAGKLHPVPMGFEFPSSTVKIMWMLWLFGHEQNHIRPYRSIRKFDLTKGKCQTRLVKARKVMETILSYSYLEDHTPGASIPLHLLDRTVADVLFESGFKTIVNVIEQLEISMGKNINVCRRIGEINYTTLYTDITQHHL